MNAVEYAFLTGMIPVGKANELVDDWINISINDSGKAAGNFMISPALDADSVYLIEIAGTEPIDNTDFMVVFPFSTSYVNVNNLEHLYSQKVYAYVSDTVRLTFNIAGSLDSKDTIRINAIDSEGISVAGEVDIYRMRIKKIF